MWYEGCIGVHSSIFHFCVKVYQRGSQYGIDGGRISKLNLRRSDIVVANYDRGWDVEPVDEDTAIAYQILLLDYNH